MLRWSAKIAYAIGLITTDGSLSKDGRHIVLVSKDIQLLRTFRECLKLKNRIRIKSSGGYSKEHAYIIQFGNIVFYRWLKKIGLMPNKTCIIGRLKIPNRYFADFLRGHLDGDGSLFTYKDTYMTYKTRKYTYFRVYTAFNSASYKHLYWVRNRLKKELNISGALNSWLKEERFVPLWTLRFAKNESLKLLQWLYYRLNLPCLKRKHNLALKIIKNCRFSNFYLASDEKTGEKSFRKTSARGGKRYAMPQSTQKCRTCLSLKQGATNKKLGDAACRASREQRLRAGEILVREKFCQEKTDISRGEKI